MPPSVPHDPQPGRLGDDLDQLLEILADAVEPIPELSRLATPERLDFLFQIELRKLVRSGPEAGLAPARLLAIAGEAAGVGVLPLATPSRVRGFLDQLASRVRAAGAWDQAAPLWWDPLPTVAQSEQLHLRWTAGLPSTEPLRQAFATSVNPSWLVLPDLLSPPLIRELSRELRAAASEGAFALERAGVGAGDQVIAQRSDSVLYLSGLEPELLCAAPAVAALIQACASQLAPRLAAAFPGRAVFAPRAAMLACYPAPSSGYHTHFDNPGGVRDNGRTLTLVLYLNALETPCRGGEIALWAANSAAAEPPSAVLPAEGGTAVVFDSRAVAHQVQPLREGPARWALTLWFNDLPQAPLSPPLPELSLADVLSAIREPPLPPSTVLFHEIDDVTPAGQIVVRTPRFVAPRVGIVSTVYRGGTSLDAWCEYHFALGFDHVVLIFDHLEEPAEAEDAARLRARYPLPRLTVWSGERLAAELWETLANRGELERFARSGASSYAVAARQTLGASVALEAARGDELGGAPLDWLLHLDADELFFLQGAGRGGAMLGEHFATASSSGLCLLRYVNHEWLRLDRPGASPCFKLNPRLGAARLGTVGWSKLVSHLRMAQSDPRPYFTGYFNGKSAVAVSAGAAAAGVHGWSLVDPGGSSRFLAGPSVLHFHFGSPTAFTRKYLAVAASRVPPGPALFQPSPVEVATLEHLRQWQRAGVDESVLEQKLSELHAAMTAFSKADIEVLEAAGMILSPHLPPGIGDTMIGDRSSIENT